MDRQKILILVLLMFLSGITSAQKSRVPVIKWKQVAALPLSEKSQSLGFAGAINGVSKDVLVVAGGSNFPHGLPWNGGKKYYSNEIHVLQNINHNYCWNRKVKSVLPEAVAYCGVTSTPAGIVYAGGENENGILNKAFMIKWDVKGSEITIKPLPHLPLALTNVALTHIGNVVFAAGGDQKNNSSNKFFSLDLDNKNSEWKMLPDLPIAVANSTLIAQNDESEKNIYLIGGRTKTESGISELHHTTFVFDLKKNEWQRRADISDGKIISNLSAAAGVAIDKNYILIIGGDNGIVFHKIENYISLIAKAGSEEEKEKLTREKNALTTNHSGFYKGLLLYNTIENRWTRIGEYPFPAQVTTAAVKWGNDIVVSNGEIKPGIRTPDVIIGTLN